MREQVGKRSGAPNQNVDFWIHHIIVAAVVVRMAVSSINTPGDILLPAVCLSVFLGLGLVQHFAGLRSPLLIQAYLIVQSLIAFGLLFIPPLHDYYALLFVALSLPVTRYLGFRPGIVWLSGMCALFSAGLLLSFGLGEGLGYIPAYVAAILFISLYGRANRKADEARAKSEELRDRLESAYRRLQESAARAEETATAQERTRLARDLHDAVTQTVFGMSLTAQAAREAYDRSPEKVPGLLQRLQEMARDALAEMRTMVEQLRPKGLAETGLAVALERDMALRRRRDGMTIGLTVNGKERGPDAAKEALFRAAQEALNNVARHAGVKAASVDLTFAETEAVLVVRDRGKGFDPAVSRPGECFGLFSMRDRAQGIGGRFRIDSTPGAGTEIEVAVPIDREEK